jgi:hypothetical protein
LGWEGTRKTGLFPPPAAAAKNRQLRASGGTGGDDMPGGEKPLHVREQAALALLSKPTIREAAEAAGVGERTLRGWLRQPKFLRLYRRLRRQAVETALGRLQEMAGDAVKTLKDLLDCDHAPSRVRAADLVLGYSLRGVEVADLAEELEGLRRELEGLRREHGNAETAGDEVAGHPPGTGVGPLSPAGPPRSGPEADPDRGGPDAGLLADGGPPLLG